MNETVTWRTWSVIQDQPVLHWESWWIQPLVSKLEEKTGISSLLCGWREAPILLLYLPPGAECDELWIQPPPAVFNEKMPQQQNSSVSRDSAQGSSSLWHKMDPNLGHKDWVRPVGGISFFSENDPFLFYSLWSSLWLSSSYFWYFPLCFTLIRLHLFPPTSPTHSIHPSPHYHNYH